MNQYLKLKHYQLILKTVDWLSYLLGFTVLLVLILADKPLHYQDLILLAMSVLFFLTFFSKLTQSAVEMGLEKDLLSSLDLTNELVTLESNRNKFTLKITKPKRYNKGMAVSVSSDTVITVETQANSYEEAKIYFLSKKQDIKWWL